MSNQPLWKQGDVAVWPPRETTNGHLVFSVSSGPQGGQKEYTGVYAQVGDYELSAEEAGRLYCGEEIEVQQTGRNGAYTALLAARGIKTESRVKDGKTYENRTLDLGLLIPMKRGSDNSLFGYKASGVLYFKEVGPKENPITLTAGDVLKLASKQAIQKDGFELTLGEVNEEQKGGYTNKTARVNVSEISEGQDVPDLGEPDQLPDLSLEASGGVKP